MMPMDGKGITWVGNIYQKFENMCLEEVEDTLFEETVGYLENQMQIVGKSVKRFYSDVMQEILPSSCDLDESHETAATDAGFCMKSFQGSKKITVSAADTKQATNDSAIDHDVDKDAIYAESFDTDTLFVSDCGISVKGNNFISNARRCVGSTDTKANLDNDENHQNKRMPASKTAIEITLSKKDICSASQSCEISNVNQNHEATNSKPSSAEITVVTSVTDCCNEIENANTEQIPSVLVLVNSADEKEMNIGFSMVRTMQPGECSSNAIIVSHPETWSLDIENIDGVREQVHKTPQQDDELKLEETCVMVTRDELQLVPNASANLKTSKKKGWQPFSLSEKSARKQEYVELAIWHGNNKNEKRDFVESLCPTLLEDQKKSLLPDTSEPEWELL